MTKVLEATKLRTMRHPFAIRSGEFKGRLPHTLDADDFLIWKIEQGMTDEDYVANLAAASEFVAQVKRYGKPVPTRNLTDDQRGWANADFRLHYQFDYAKWFINPDKPSKPMPATYRLQRHRQYAERCACKSRKRKQFWSMRHDGRALLQCPNCGEVILAKASYEPPEEL